MNRNQITPPSPFDSCRFPEDESTTSSPSAAFAPHNTNSTQSSPTGSALVPHERCSSPAIHERESSIVTSHLSSPSHSHRPCGTVPCSATTSKSQQRQKYPDIYNIVSVDDLIAYEYLSENGNWKWGVARVIRLRGKRSVDLEAWDAVGLHTPANVPADLSDELDATEGGRKSRSKSHRLQAHTPSKNSIPTGLSGITTGLWVCPPPGLPGCAVPLSTVICVLKSAAVDDVDFRIDNVSARIVMQAMWCQRQPLVVVRDPKAIEDDAILVPQPIIIVEDQPAVVLSPNTMGEEDMQSPMSPFSGSSDDDIAVTMRVKSNITWKDRVLSLLEGIVTTPTTDVECYRLGIVAVTTAVTMALVLNSIKVTNIADPSCPACKVTTSRPLPTLKDYVDAAATTVKSVL